MRSIIFFTTISLLLLITTAFAICPCKKQNSTVENETNLTKIIATSILGGEVEEIRKEKIAQCGNKICEKGETIQSCPQDCSPKAIISKKEELTTIVGRFVLVNAFSIITIASLAILVLTWFFIKRKK